MILHRELTFIEQIVYNVKFNIGDKVQSIITDEIYTITAVWIDEIITYEAQHEKSELSAFLSQGCIKKV